MTVRKMPRYGFVLVTVLVISLMFLAFTPQTGYAADTEKEEAIEAADRAIRFLPSPGNIMFSTPELRSDIAEAQELVETAKDVHGATDDDFANLDKLSEVKEQTAKRKAIQDARDAIDAMPPPFTVTEEDRAAVEEARRLVDYAVEEHGVTLADICKRVDRLEDAEERLDEEPEPEPEPTPPTGGVSALGLVGALLTGTGLLFAIKTRNQRY